MVSAFGYLAAAALGLLAGAMLLIAAVFVPFWQAIEPAEFSRWFREHSPLLARIMLPLGASATILSVIAAAVARPVSSPPFRWFAVAAALAVAVAALYPLYFASANTALADAGRAASETAASLERWRVWHLARTAAGVLAFLAALRGLALSNG